MLRRNFIQSLLLIIALISSACQPIARPPTPKPQPPQGLRPDAPPFAVHGPFAVGYKSLVIGEGTTRPLELSLWYPALNPTGIKEEITYSLTLKFKEAIWAPDTPPVVYGHAIRNAAIDTSKGPYPLVVFSHGFTDNAVNYNTLVEHYASYGFIILAPEHSEKFDFAASDLWTASIDRPRDVKQVLDYAEQATTLGGQMAGLIDMKHVAVVGHSYGGYTALAMAGAQYNLAAFNARCASLAKDDPHADLCKPLLPKETDMAARAGLTPMPQGLWPSLGDSRVTAIVTMAGDSYLFDKAGLAKITIPMMALGGTTDTSTPYEWGAKPAYENASSTQKALVTFVGAEHMIFTTPCTNKPWMVTHPAYAYFCFDPVWDRDRAQDMIRHFSTAFLLDTLKNDNAAHTALLTDKVNFPGVAYTTTLK